MENFKAVVEHDLLVGDCVYTVGTTKVTATFGCALNEWEENIAPECDIEVKMVSKTNVGDDDWICLYEVFTADNEFLYYITGTKTLYNEAGYHKAVSYAPINADRISVALKQYHKTVCEWL